MCLLIRVYICVWVCSPCTLLEWSEDGEMLAIVQANSAALVLWEPKKIREHQLVDLPCKDISFMKWSKTPHSKIVRYQ